MKFSVAVLTGLLGAVTAANSLPEAFTLVANGGHTVLTDGSNAYVGGGTTETKEILILRSGANGAVSFTSKNGVPTAFQNLYIIENSVSPVAFTVPHSGAMPEGANMTNFGVDSKGYFTQGGRSWFAVDGYGDNEVKELYWYGAHNAEYATENLYVKECKGC